MSMLNRTRHLLTPLSALLLASPAISMAEQNTPDPTPVIRSEAAQITHKGAKLSADDDGRLHLRISHELMISKPDQLKDALLEVILNSQTHRSTPTEVDGDGKIHYLVELGKNESGTELFLKPVSLESPVTKAISDIATGTLFLLSMKAVDKANKYKNGGDSFQFGSVDEDFLYQSFPRNYLRQGMLLSAFGTGEAISTLGSAALGRTKGEQRTNLADALPDFASTGLMALASRGAYTGNVDIISASEWRDIISLYSMSSTTNTLSTTLQKTIASIGHDLTDWSDQTIDRSAQASQIVLSSTILAILSKYSDYKPGSNDSKSWGKNFLTSSMAITVTYNVRELASDFVTDMTGSKTWGEFLTAGVMAAGAGIVQARNKGRLKFNNMTYKETSTFMAAEAAGASLGFGLQRAVNALVGDESSSKARAARIGTAFVAAVALKGATELATLYIPGGRTWKKTFTKVLGPMGDGVIIANMFDIMNLTSETVVEPWFVKPIAQSLGLATPNKQLPALRLRANVIRRPLLEG
ncbi:hypothetical protein [Parendozoicomonas sp. Alg238-R29]|uniref:hypothetical protein n=1 Tax=Parendozoicomonas sp. Alg238-R29 TaxID=2993446 RepID=UPI00248D901A|nr:hypothetical protein [Parendozoicomonas sp. Alg238-R29]